MSYISKLTPFVWPQRWKILGSVLCAFLVAALWAANLSAVFPVAKTLLEGQSLGDHIASELKTAEVECRHLTGRLQELEEQLQSGGGDPSIVVSADHVHLLKDKARVEEKLSDVSRKLWLLNSVSLYVLPWAPDDEFDTFALILGLLLFATLLKGVLIFTQDILVCSAVELTTIGLREECFRKTLALDYQTLAKEGTGNLMSRITYDTSMMASALSYLGGKVVREPLKALACIVLAFYLQWQLTLLAIVFFPVIGLTLYKIGAKIRKASHRVMDSMSRIYKSLEESLSGLKIVIAFNGARRHRENFHNENMAYYRRSMRTAKVRSLSHPLIELMGLFAVCLTLLPGAYLVLRGTTEIWEIKLTSEVMDFADLAWLYALLIGVLDPLRKLSPAYGQIQQTLAASERVFSFTDRQSLVAEAESPVPLPRHSKSIIFDQVSFKYVDEADRPAALKDINVTINAGEVVAVVGANGSGKSTLVNLLPRFFDPDSGAVFIDGTDIREAALEDLRNQMGLVSQETILFDDTIEGNIRYGRFEATAEEVAAAMKKASVDQIIEGLPEGAQTRVGTHGHSLSGGQRQRIALARAMLRDPAILILDEATSAVDAESERLIHEALGRFAQGRTVFIVTHALRPSLLEFVDRILVMQDGRVIASGPHESLVNTCPEYQVLCQSNECRRAA